MKAQESECHNRSSSSPSSNLISGLFSNPCSVIDTHSSPLFNLVYSFSPVTKEDRGKVEESEGEGPLAPFISRMVIHVTLKGQARGVSEYQTNATVKHERLETVIKKSNFSCPLFFFPLFYC